MHPATWISVGSTDTETPVTTVGGTGVGGGTITASDPETHVAVVTLPDTQP
jgi:hypothetical protein